MFGGLGTAINNLGSTLISGLGQKILDLGKFIVDGVIDGLKAVFIPSDDFFSNNFDSMKIALSDKLNVDSYNSILNSFSSASQGQFSDVEITIMGSTGKVLDGQWISRVLGTVHNWIRGLMFILLVLYNYNQIYKLIRGTDIVSVSGTINHMRGGEGK